MRLGFGLGACVGSFEKKKCEEERLGVCIYIGRYVYIRPCFPFFLFILLLFG